MLLRSYSTSTGRSRGSKTVASVLAAGAGAGAGLGWFYCQRYSRQNPPLDVFPLDSVTRLSDLTDSPQYASESEVAVALTEIKALLRDDQITESPNELLNHSDSDSNFHKPHDGERPYIVVYPETEEEVVSLMKVCNKYRVPVVPYSGGTSIEGHYIPTRRGVSIDVGRMNKVLALHDDDLDVVIEPGVGWQELEEYLKPHGLLFGPDPGPGACIGGMVATNCSGTRATRYGTMKDNVIGLRVVLSDGTVIKTKRRPRKSSAGYNMTGLFVGSEGTLGIVTQATLKLHVLPENEVIATVNFDTIEDAARTVTNIFRKGIQVNAVELMDDRQMKCIKEMDEIHGDKHINWSDKTMLMFKLGGSKATLKETTDRVWQIAAQNHGSNWKIAVDQDTKDLMWAARKTQLWTSIEWARKKIPDARSWTTDIAVPVSKLPKVITETVNDIEGHGLITTVVGHVGDGNIHALVIFPPEKIHVAEEVIDNLARRAIENDGTVSGEHGVGIGKRGFLVEELGPDAVGSMRKVKLALDPKMILNPDKVFKIDPAENRADKY